MLHRFLGKTVIISTLLLSTALAQEQARQVQGDVAFPDQWIVFGPLERDDAVLPESVLGKVPETISVDGKTITPTTVEPMNHQFNLTSLLGEPPKARDRVAYIFLPIASEREQTVTLGMGADYLLQAWVNGKEVLDTTDAGNLSFPPAITDYRVDVDLKKGRNVLAVRFISGKASSLVAIGGPRALRDGNFKSIHGDPLIRGDARWTREGLRASVGEKSVVDIGSRRELFVDDFMVDRLTGGAERRMHHPTPRNVVMTFDKPWEGNATAYCSIVEHEGEVRIYYNVRPQYPGGGAQSTALITSDDGIHFTRPSVGDIEFEGSTDNNMIWRRNASGHNFTVFKDANPDAPADQRFKAIAYHPEGAGLGAYVSRDGINWRLLVEKKIIPRYHPETGEQQGGFDSQNLAFWDALREEYVCYFRAPDPRGTMRGISVSTSKDFINWTEPKPLHYPDGRREHMYTNVIRPYDRAPHIYIGTPARYVPRRTKVDSHSNNGISDAILMSSRDGIVFDRWEEGFVRPRGEWQVWTDRNNYPAWGMVQTSPTQLSMYWTEHYRHPGMRLRRGTIRIDGFVSLHADGNKVGEMLTRPLIFRGDKLRVNYATSAIGALRFEICDQQGEPIENFTLGDSEILFGNEIDHTVTWNGRSDVEELAGRVVRLRVRLHDADLYALKFGE